MNRELDKWLKPQIRFLIDCRPHSPAMGNAIKHLRQLVLQTPPDMTLADAKRQLCAALDEYVANRVVGATSVLVGHGLSRIDDGDVVLTFGRSNAVERLLLSARAAGRRFRAVVVSARPRNEGRALLRALVRGGVPCTFVLLSGLSWAMQEVTKVFLGAAAVMSNGAVFSRAGTSLVAMAAKRYRAPVLFCAETYKFCERVQLDSICYNELGDPDRLVDTQPGGGYEYNQEGTAWGGGGVGAALKTGYCGGYGDPRCGYPRRHPYQGPGAGGAIAEPLEGWREQENLLLLNLEYDLTPSEFVDGVVTELGLVPPTSVPVIIREREKAGVQ